jgi:hypothetical protein
MATSDVEIVNQALILIGANTIASLADPQSEAVVAKTLYDGARASMLRQVPFSFATKWAGPLAPLVPNIGKEFQYEFQIPPDALRVIRVREPYTAGVTLDVRDLSEWKVFGKRIGTTIAQIDIAYTADVEESQDDSLFQQMLAAWLAYLMAPALAQKDGVQDRMLKQFSFLQDQAQLVGALEGVPDRFRTEGRLVTARRGGNAGDPFR